MSESTKTEPPRDEGHHGDPGDPWTFGPSVAIAFEDMLRRSIPQIDVMRTAVLDVGSRFVKPGTDVVDLGSSRGDAVSPLVERFGALVRFHLVERAPAMLEILRARFAGYLSTELNRTPVLRIHDLDLRTAFPPGTMPVSLCQAVLTLQFVPIEYRAAILYRARERMIDGGAFVLVEKVLGEGFEINETFVSLYEQMKALNGYSREEIDRKRLALEGVLVPQTARANEAMLRTAGFSKVECFWRWMNFAAWVAIR